MVKKFGDPKQNELVICKVDEITEFAAWCSLLEYPEYKGMIHVSEVASRWVRDIRNYVKKGKQYVAKVIKVEPEKKFVNLSLKRVSSFEEKEKWNEFRKEQRAEKVFELAAEKIGKTLDDFYNEYGRKILEKYDSFSEFLEKALNNKKILNIFSEEWKKAIEEFIERIKKEKIVRIKAVVECLSLKSNGLEIIKQSLKKFEDAKFKVTYLGSGKYLVQKDVKDPKRHEKKLSKIADEIRKNFDKFEIKVIS